MAYPIGVRDEYIGILLQLSSSRTFRLPLTRGSPFIKPLNKVISVTHPCDWAYPISTLYFWGLTSNLTSFRKRSMRRHSVMSTVKPNIYVVCCLKHGRNNAPPGNNCRIVDS